MVLSLLTPVTVAVGGCAGGIIRFACSRLSAKNGTLIANVVGCLAIGLSLGVDDAYAPLVATGFAGGCSTWSTYIKELGLEIQQRRYKSFLVRCVVPFLFGWAAFQLGATLPL